MPCGCVRLIDSDSAEAGVGKKREKGRGLGFLGDDVLAFSWWISVQQYAKATVLSPCQIRNMAIGVAPFLLLVIQIPR